MFCGLIPPSSQLGSCDVMPIVCSFFSEVAECTVKHILIILSLERKAENVSVSLKSVNSIMTLSLDCKFFLPSSLYTTEFLIA